MPRVSNVTFFLKGHLGQAVSYMYDIFAEVEGEAVTRSVSKQEKQQSEKCLKTEEMKSV